MQTHAIILFAHGARDPEWARPFEALRHRVSALLPECRVELAFLELTQPALPAVVANLADHGSTDITIVPVFLAQGGHVKRDLPGMVESLRVAHPDISIEVLPAIGEQPAVIEAIAGSIARAAGH
jgi:sirohydrochlorin cobaltochelatase